MSIVDFFLEEINGGKTSPAYNRMSLSFWPDENYCRTYSKHRFVCTVDEQSKNTSRFAKKSWFFS